MFRDVTVPVPEIPGKLVFMKGYVYLETGRTYHPDKKYNQPHRIIIGKLASDDRKTMHPNGNYYKVFPGAEDPGVAEPDRVRRVYVGLSAETAAKLKERAEAEKKSPDDLAQSIIKAALG